MNKALKDDPAKVIATLDGPMRDGPGWLWRRDLPHGVTAGAVSEKREELASGLRRPLGCVWPETDHKRHPGALNLYVADEDMTTAVQPPWPLAKRGAADMFKPKVFSFDPRGRAIMVTLMFVSIIIGSIPRMGKTFLLGLLLLICGKPRGLTRVCVSNSRRKQTLKPRLSFGTCPRCRKPYGSNPLAHTCAPKPTSASARRSSRKSSGRRPGRRRPARSTTTRPARTTSASAPCASRSRPASIPATSPDTSADGAGATTPGSPRARPPARASTPRRPP